jgi:hypothetical protein
MINMWFCCDNCGNLDHLRCSVSENSGGQQLCGRCIHGEWHGAFPEEKYDPHLHEVINRPTLPEFADSISIPSFG